MRFCGQCGAPLNEPPGAAGDETAAQRRQLTVLFCDLVESTALAERLDPEEFRDALGGYHAAVARAVERFDGHIAQYQGDGVIAYFGYPRAHEDDAGRAAHAGLAILGELATLNQQLRDSLGEPLAARIGLHTGVAVTGELGSGRSRERQAAVGEVLHVAARVQTVALPGTVVVTDTTLALVGDGFEARTLGEHELKGISHPVPLYEIARAVHAGAAAGALVGRGAAGIVDRAPERAALLEMWQHARAGEGVVAHVCGDAGIGKSRLVEALREHVRDEAAAEWLLRCSAHHTSTPLYPVLQLLEESIDLDRSQPEDAQVQRLREWLARAGETQDGAEMLLADLLSVRSLMAGEPSLVPREARNATLQLLERLLLGDPASGPLLLVVEDLHWADPSTIELLERLASRLGGRPAMAVLTFRREFEPSWTRWVEVTEVKLGPLDGQHVRTLAATAGPPLADDELRRVEQAAEGVPLFIEEMVKLMTEQPVAAGARAGAVPATLQGLMAERLDRLPELAGLIDTAAVLGREFETDMLGALSGLGRGDFRSAVAQLAAHDVLRPVQGSRARLEFRHALLQEAAYERVLHRRRRVLHRQVAELLGSRGSPAWQAQPELIAHHWSAAAEPAQALGHWEAAGHRALERASFLEAAEHFRRAVEALDETHPAPAHDLERGELLTHWGAALQAGRSPAADVGGIFARAQETYRRTRTPERLVPAMRGQFLMHSARAEYSTARDVAAEMLELGDRFGRGAWIAEARFYVGFAHLLLGELAPARAELEAAIAAYEPPGRSDYIYEAQADPGVAARAYLSTLLFHVGATDEALAMSDESVELAARTGGPVTHALCWGMRCALLLVAGRGSEFMQSLESTRAFCVERNIGYWSDVCSMWSAWVLALNGDPTAHLAQRAQYTRYLESGGRVGIPHFAGLLAEGELASGEKALALAAVREAQAHIDRAGERFYEPELRRLTGHVLMADPDPDPVAAKTELELAVGCARAQDAKLLELRCAIALARVQRRLGEAPTAIERVAELVDWFGPEATAPDVERGRSALEKHAEAAAQIPDPQAG